MPKRLSSRSGKVRKRKPPPNGMLAFAQTASGMKRLLRSLEAYIPTKVFTSDQKVHGEVLQLNPIQEHAKSAQASISRAKSVCYTRKSRTARRIDFENTVNNHRHTHIILFPGNPGLIEFYRDLMRIIWEQLPEEVCANSTMHGLGLPGHDVRKLNDDRRFGIADHVQYASSYLENVSPPVETSNLVFIGHSYGSYLILRILEANPDLRKRAYFMMLMPAIWYLQKCAGSVLTSMLTGVTRSITTKVAEFVTALLARSPRSLRSTMLGLSGNDSHASDVLQSWIENGRRDLYNNITELLSHEVRDIQSPEDHDFVESLGPRSYLYVVENGDKWCPPEALDAIKAAFGARLTTHIESASTLSHAFVLKDAETELVAEKLSNWITEITEKNVTHEN